MISSTQTDLQAERNAADQVITSLHYESLRSETYAALGLSSEEICLRMAEECDLCICILGFSYGSIPSKLGISVTEMEYQRARQIDPGKLLVYLKREESSIKIEQKQRRFRKRVQDFSLGYFRHSHFSNTDELQQQIRKDMAAWVTEVVAKERMGRTAIAALQNELMAARANIELFKPKGLRLG